MLSTYLKNKLLDSQWSRAAYTPAATVYFALFNGDPTAGGTEIALARVAMTNNATNFPAASGGSKQNGVKISFGSTAGQNALGTATYLAALDAPSGGNLLEYTALGGGGINCNDSAEVNIPAGSATFVWA